jgi:HK97 family phage portal protein
MNVRDSLRFLFSPMPNTERQYPPYHFVDPASIPRTDTVTRSEDWPDLTESIRNVLAPWKNASIQDALGVPAIFRAVSLIANTTGQLAVEVWRQGVQLDDDQTPQLVKRPDPYKTPRDFYRDTAFNMATRGEAWWWIARRDANGVPISLINVPPWEIVVDPGTNRLKPMISWLGKTMPNDDMKQMTFLPDVNSLRGIGPLQACGAAISVSVEAQQWAANFFAGGNSSVLIKVAGALGEGEDGEEEAAALRTQFMDKDNNTPRIIDDGIEDVREISVNEQGAQMLDARQHNNGDAARMFGIPGVLMEYATAGSSLTYQNISEVFTLFVKTCLQPNYLEPIEQTMSDLLPRTQKAEFNVAGFQRADPKTRWETYNLAVPVIGQEEAASWAREAEGFTPGDAEFAPIPYSPPQAVPDRLPIARATEELRCNGRRIMGGVMRPCNKLLSESGVFVGMCPRCRKVYEAA